MERFARATAVAAALAAAWIAAPVGAADSTPLSASIGDAGSEVVFRALSLLGVNYRFGGNTPETGLDCSGLVRLVYSDALGLPLPRRSEEISRVGPAVAPTELQPGDLVFFNTLRRAFSHVGIYIGNNQFVHAPSTGGSIRVENLGADYWTRRFDGARRLLTQDLLAAASMNPLSASAARAMQASASARSGRPAAPVASALPPASARNPFATAPATSGGASGTTASGWSSASAPVWAATDGMPAGYGMPLPAANVPSAVPPQAPGTSAPGATGSPTIEARTAPLNPGTTTMPPTAPNGLAATATLAAATPILPPEAANAASAAARVPTAPAAARAADTRAARPDAPRAKPTVRVVAKPARPASAPKRAPVSTRAESRPAEQPIAARPARRDVFVN